MNKKLLSFAFIFLICTKAYSQPQPPEVTIYSEGPTLKVEWSTVEDASGYKLHYSLDQTFEDSNTIDLGPLTKIFGNIRTDGATYFVGISAYNVEGESPISNIKSVTISANNIFYPPKNNIALCAFDEPVKTSFFSCELKDFEDYGYGKLTDFTITTDVIFVDSEERKEELSALDPDEIDTWCARGVHLDESSFSFHIEQPLLGLTDNDRSALSGMLATTNYGRVYYLYLGLESAGEMIFNSLKAWADAGSLLDTDFYFNPGIALDVKISLLSYIRAWEAVRSADFVPIADRRQIDSYLETLALKVSYIEALGLDLDEPTGLDVFNHSWRQDVALMAYGIANNKNFYFQRGIGKYFAIMDGLIRSDGSHFYESQRGGSALGYSITATSLLMRLAEMATIQGYNLYEMEVNGLTFHDVMEFHVSALEDNELIHEYTFDNFAACDGDQCSTWDDQTYGYNYDFELANTQFADFEIYKRRFPDSEITQRLEAFFPQSIFTPMSDGNMVQTCEFREVN